MNNLEKIIRDRIIQHGPISVGEYMMMALCHPKYGYYMSKDPFGKDGDFTTAPEISQIFGELVGVWVINRWIEMGSPEKFILVECGPGRGTLMSDILRVASKAKGLMEAVDIRMVETSPVLIEKQKEVLKGFNIKWCENISEITNNVPVIVIGNEFFDALPVEHLVKLKDRWVQKVISIDKIGKFCYGLREVMAGLKPEGIEGKEEDIYEFAPVRAAYMRNVCELIKSNGGGALFIDYGHFKSSVGDTLQAVKNHKYVDILEDTGNADITSHVDFEMLARVAKEVGVSDIKLSTQRNFLLKMGLKERAAALMKVADEKQQNDIVCAVKRLSGTDNGEMGELFKVIEVNG